MTSDRTRLTSVGGAGGDGEESKDDEDSDASSAAAEDDAMADFGRARQSSVKAAATAAAAAATKLLVTVELPALDVRTQLSFAYSASEQERIHDGTRELLDGFAERFGCGLVRADEALGVDRLQEVRHRAIAEFDGWQQRLAQNKQLAEDWKLKADQACERIVEMRDSYYKEIAHLQEQLHQKRKAEEAGETFEPVTGSHFDMSRFVEPEVQRLVGKREAELKKEFDAQLAVQKEESAEKIGSLNEQLAVMKMNLLRKTALYETSLSLDISYRQVETAKGPLGEALEALASFRTFLRREFKGGAQDVSKVLASSHTMVDEVKAADFISIAGELGYKSEPVKALQGLLLQAASFPLGELLERFFDDSPRPLQGFAHHRDSDNGALASRVMALPAASMEEDSDWACDSSASATSDTACLTSPVHADSARGAELAKCSRRKKAAGANGAPGAPTAAASAAAGSGAKASKRKVRVRIPTGSRSVACGSKKNYAEVKDASTDPMPFAMAFPPLMCRSVGSQCTAPPPPTPPPLECEEGLQVSTSPKNGVLLVAAAASVAAQAAAAAAAAEEEQRERVAAAAAAAAAEVERAAAAAAVAATGHAAAFPQSDGPPFVLQDGDFSDDVPSPKTLKSAAAAASLPPQGSNEDITAAHRSTAGAAAAAAAAFASRVWTRRKTGNMARSNSRKPTRNDSSGMPSSSPMEVQADTEETVPPRPLLVDQGVQATADCEERSVQVETAPPMQPIVAPMAALSIAPPKQPRASSPQSQPFGHWSGSVDPGSAAGLSNAFRDAVATVGAAGGERGAGGGGRVGSSAGCAVPSAIVAAAAAATAEIAAASESVALSQVDMECSDGAVPAKATATPVSSLMPLMGGAGARSVTSPNALAAFVAGRPTGGDSNRCAPRSSLGSMYITDVLRSHLPTAAFAATDDQLPDSTSLRLGADGMAATTSLGGGMAATASLGGGGGTVRPRSIGSVAPPERPPGSTAPSARRRRDQFMSCPVSGTLDSTDSAVGECLEISPTSGGSSGSSPVGSAAGGVGVGGGPGGGGGATAWSGPASALPKLRATPRGANPFRGSVTGARQSGSKETAPTAAGSDSKAPSFVGGGGSASAGAGAPVAPIASKGLAIRSGAKISELDASLIGPVEQCGSKLLAPLSPSVPMPKGAGGPHLTATSSTAPAAAAGAASARQGSWRGVGSAVGMVGASSLGAPSSSAAQASAKRGRRRISAT